MKPNRLRVIAVLLTCVLVFASCGTTGDKSARDGKELYIQGSYAEALENLLDAESKGVKTFRTSELYCYIGNCYFQQEDYDRCIEYEIKCLDIDPKYFNAWVSLGVAYRKTGKTDKAMSCYENALNFDPQNQDSANLYVSLGSIYIEKGKPISAIEYLEKAQALYTDAESATVYAYLAIAYKMALEPEKSAEAFEKAKELEYPKLDEIQAQLDKIQ